MKLKCKLHERRVWVNPITGTVLHRSSNKDNSDLRCSTPQSDVRTRIVGYNNVDADSAMTVAHVAAYASCMHCGLPAPTNWSWAYNNENPICKKRQGHQQHVYG